LDVLYSEEGVAGVASIVTLDRNPIGVPKELDPGAYRLTVECEADDAPSVDFTFLAIVTGLEFGVTLSDYIGPPLAPLTIPTLHRDTPTTFVGSRLVAPSTAGTISPYPSFAVGATEAIGPMPTYEPPTPGRSGNRGSDHRRRQETLELLGSIHRTGSEFRDQARGELAEAWRDNMIRVVRAAYGNAEAAVFIHTLPSEHEVEDDEQVAWLDAHLAPLARFIQRAQSLALRDEFTADDWNDF
jgi:hypothetical protein